MKQLKFRAILKGETDFTYTDGVMTHKDGTVIICISKDDETLMTSPIEPESLRMFTGLRDKNEQEIYELDPINLHLFTQSLGEILGVYESETEIEGLICFEELGLAFKPLNNFEQWFYLFDAPGMIHEESFELIKQKP